MAVYTKLTFAEIQNHLQNYDLGELLEFREILAGIDNSNFIIYTQKGKFILTIFEGRINRNDLPFFINFKLHLAQKGILCPRPILNNQGLAIVDLKKKKSAIVSFLNGKTLEPQNDGHYSDITVNHCAEVGAMLAKLHLAALDFEGFRENDLGVKGFRTLFAKFEHLLSSVGARHAVPANMRDFDVGTPWRALTEIIAAINFVESHWNPDLPSASAHLDLFPDNVFFDENQQISGIIDFYFAANDLLIYDFAIVVNAWCFDEKNNFDEEKFLALKNSYEKIRKFSDEELNFLEIALIAAALRFLLTRLHDMFFTPKDSHVVIKNPWEYLVKLKYFFNRGAFVGGNS